MNLKKILAGVLSAAMVLTALPMAGLNASATETVDEDSATATIAGKTYLVRELTYDSGNGDIAGAYAESYAANEGPANALSDSASLWHSYYSSTGTSRNKSILKGLKLTGNNKIYLTLNEATAISKLTYTGRNNNGDIISANVYAITNGGSSESTNGSIDMTNAVKIGEWNDLAKGATATVTFENPVSANIIVIEALTTHASDSNAQVAARQIVLYTRDSEGTETAVQNITPTADFSPHGTGSLGALLDADTLFESIWSGSGTYVQKEENNIDNTYPYLVENNNFYIELNNKTALGQLSYIARTSDGNNGVIKGANVYVAEKAETAQEAGGTEKTEDQILEEMEALSWAKVGTFTTNGNAGATANCVFTRIADADYVRIEGLTANTDGANFLSAKQFKLYEASAEVVDGVSLTMDKPYAGEKIADYVPADSSDSYSAAVSFAKQDGSGEAEATTFEAGTYTATVTVTAAENCVFAENAAYTLNGEMQTAELIRNENGNVVSASFTFDIKVTAESNTLCYESITLDGTAGKNITFDAKRFFTTGTSAGTSLIFTAMVKFDEEHAGEKQTLFTLSDGSKRYMSIVVQPYTTKFSGRNSYLGIETSSGNSLSSSAGWYNTINMKDGNWHKIVVMVGGTREVFLIDGTDANHGSWGSEALVGATPFLNANSVPSTVSLGGSLRSLGIVESDNATHAASNFSGTIGYIKVVKNKSGFTPGGANGSSLANDLNEKTDATVNAKRAALDVVPTDMSGYTPTSVAAVETAKTALEGLNTSSSATIEAAIWNAIDDLENAVASLQLKTELASADVTVAEPVVGEELSTHVIVAREDTGKYTAEVSWRRESPEGSDEGVAAGGDTWTATVTLTPTEDYVFAESISVNVNGDSCVGTKNGNTVSVSKTFTVDDGYALAPMPTIRLVAPAEEKIPEDAVVTNGNDAEGNPQYANVTTVWSVTNGDVLNEGAAFTSGTPYTATVTITPTTGTKFTAASCPDTVTVGEEEKTVFAVIDENGNLIVTADFAMNSIVINNPQSGRVELTDAQQAYLDSAESYVISVLFKYDTKTAGRYYPLLTMEGTNSGRAEFITLWHAPQRGNGDDGAICYDTSGTISASNPAGWFFSTGGSNQMADGWYKATYHITANQFTDALNGTNHTTYNKNDTWASAFDPLFTTEWSSLSVGTGANVTYPNKNYNTHPADPFEFDGTIRRVEITTASTSGTAESINESVAENIKKELADLCVEANALEESDYTTESWSTFSTALTNAKELADPDVADGTATATNNITKYDWTICNAIDALKTAMAGLKRYFIGSSVTLGGKVGLNFYTDQTDTNDVTVKFTKGAGETETEVPGIAKEYTKDDNTTALYYTFELPAKEMADTVTATMYDSDGNQISTATQSVKDYAEKLLGLGAYSESGALTENPQEIALAKAMLNYGAAAQMNFNYNANADNLANCNLVDNDKIVEAIGNDLDTVCGGQGLVNENYRGFSLVLKSETTLKLYFKAGTTVTVRDADGNVVNTETGTSGGEMYYKINNIKANDLGDEYTVYVGTGDNAERIGSVSALTYCYEVKGSENEALVKTVNALYRYHKAAIAYEEFLSSSFEQATE